VTAAEAAYTRAKTHRDFSAAAVANKLRAPVELARAEADLARFDVGRIRAKGGLDLARGLYSAAVGAPSALLDTTGSPAALPAMPTLEQAVAEAAKRDPALKALVAATKAQEATTTAIGAESRPNVYLSSTLSARAGGAPVASGSLAGSGFVPSVPNWDVGLVVSWPFFDGVVQKRKEASKAKEDTLHAEIDLQKQKQLAAVRRAWFDVKVAESSLPALEKAQEAAKLTYGQTEARFKEGLATTIELADAEALLADAEIQLAIGRFELMRRRAIFSRIVAEGA
jgi:outer membrane protein TolC